MKFLFILSIIFINTYCYGQIFDSYQFNLNEGVIYDAFLDDNRIIISSDSGISIYEDSIRLIRINDSIPLGMFKGQNSRIVYTFDGWSFRVWDNNQVTYYSDSAGSPDLIHKGTELSNGSLLYQNPQNSVFIRTPNSHSIIATSPVFDPDILNKSVIEYKPGFYYFRYQNGQQLNAIYDENADTIAIYHDSMIVNNNTIYRYSNRPGNGLMIMTFDGIIETIDLQFQNIVYFDSFNILIDDFPYYFASTNHKDSSFYIATPDQLLKYKNNNIEEFTFQDGYNLDWSLPGFRIVSSAISNDGYLYIILRSGLVHKFQISPIVQIEEKNVIFDNQKLLYPNPNRGEFHLKNNLTNPIISFQIINGQGYSVLDNKVDNKNYQSEIRIDTNLKHGYYLIKVLYKNGFTDVERLLINN